MDKPASIASRADPELLALVRSTPPFDPLPDEVLTHVIEHHVLRTGRLLAGPMDIK